MRTRRSGVRDSSPGGPMHDVEVEVRGAVARADGAAARAGEGDTPDGEDNTVAEGRAVLQAAGSARVPA